MRRVLFPSLWPASDVGPGSADSRRVKTTGRPERCDEGLAAYPLFDFHSRSSCMRISDKMWGTLLSQSRCGLNRLVLRGGVSPEAGQTHIRLAICVVSLDMRCCLSWPESGENVNSASHFACHRRLIKGFLTKCLFWILLGAETTARRSFGDAG
ncbi:hypothetical protein B0T13DRAFT_211146 [Neurospora crassa]|nr:hypothetical protein B0T13DRAFT_211146 [Neurospora crassa]